MVAKQEAVWHYRFEPVAEDVQVTESFELRSAADDLS